MSKTLIKLSLCTALILAAAAPGSAGEVGAKSEQALPLTPIAYTPNGKPVTATKTAPNGVRVAGAECPTGSGSYCSDELPYCCPGVSVDPYCAKDVNGCTQ